MKTGMVAALIRIIQALSQLIVLSLLSQFYGVSLVGDFSFVNAVLVVVFMFFSFGLRQAYVLEHDSFSFRSLMAFRMLSLIIGICVCFISIFIANKDLLFIFYPLALYRVTELIAELQWAKYQVEKQFVRILCSQAGRYVVSVVSLFLLTSLGEEVLPVLWGYSISGIVYILLFDGLRFAKNLKKGGPSVDFRVFFKIFLPMSINLTAMSMQNNCTRIFIGLFGTSQMLGLFAIAYQVFTMSFMIFMSVLNFYLKKDKNTIDERSQEKGMTVKKLYIFSLVLVLSLAIGWSAFGKLFLTLVFGAEFESIFVPVFFLLGALLFKTLGYCHQWRLTNMGKYRTIAKHQLLIAFVTIAIAAFLINFFALEGAYLTILITTTFYYIYFACLQFKLNRKVKV